jgi:hypothetical protein
MATGFEKISCSSVTKRFQEYAPPICDVLQVMLFNTNEDFLQHFFHSLLADYHNWLKEELEKY